jgi:hypothetical protein
VAILDTTANLATVPLNLVGGLFGNPFDPKGGHQAITTQSQRDYLDNLVNQQGGTSGVLSYGDYGTKFNLSDLTDPTAFSTAMTMGGTGWNKADTGDITYTGGKYDFDGAVPFIDKGGLMGISHDLGGSIYDFIHGPQMKFKQQQLMNQRKQQMQQRIRQAEAAEAAKQKAAAEAAAAKQAALQAQVTAQANREAKQRVSRGEARDYGKTETRASSGWESSPFEKGGLVNFYRYGGFI